MSSVREVVVKLKAVGRNTGPGARTAATAMGRSYQRGVVAGELSRYSHPRGTPTPSPAGEPPARVSGALARSIRADPARETGPDRWETTVGPSIVYGRIQELGGVSGQGHRTVLPPRPYLAPALKRMTSELHRVAVEVFRNTLNE